MGGTWVCRKGPSFRHSSCTSRTVLASPRPTPSRSPSSARDSPLTGNREVSRFILIVSIYFIFSRATPLFFTLFSPCISGGYNLKAGAGSMIELMKFDMGGCAAVFGAAKAIAQLRPKVRNCFIFFLTDAVVDTLVTTSLNPNDFLLNVSFLLCVCTFYRDRIWRCILSLRCVRTWCQPRPCVPEISSLPPTAKPSR